MTRSLAVGARGIRLGALVLELQAPTQRAKAAVTDSSFGMNAHIGVDAADIMQTHCLLYGGERAAKWYVTMKHQAREARHLGFLKNEAQLYALLEPARLLRMRQTLIAAPSRKQ